MLKESRERMSGFSRACLFTMAKAEPKPKAKPKAKEVEKFR